MLVKPSQAYLLQIYLTIYVRGEQSSQGGSIKDKAPSPLPVPILLIHSTGTECTCH
ncbi:hypothetical protein E2C01_051303 [Portunus trituberculatus]|uniref:Uncharacterized protein n=1 Tax=Portunus trituberculatus TaxID=210409 RepID=A0A5B7GIT9_PORTR|nr:hypothetical protein [Portunus trituberculatus]